MQKVTKLKCNDCGWTGTPDQLGKKYIGYEYDIEPIPVCPNCSSYDINPVEEAHETER